MTFQTQILTLYPEMFPGPLGTSLAGRALEEGKWVMETINPRDFATDKHRSVDDTPAGGGAGMVLRADVMAAAVDFAVERMDDLLPSREREGSGEGLNSSDTCPPQTPPAYGRGLNAPILAMTPRGKSLTQARIREIASGPGVTIICGRFEGFDERLFDVRPIEQVSIGDYILSGGEMGAMVLLDACIRLLPGVMGAPESGDDESFEKGLLEYPQYTRPQKWEGRIIPEVLRSGDHAKIAAWRKQRAEEDTRLRRPDLWERHRDAPDQSPSGAQGEKENKEDRS